MPQVLIVREFDSFSRILAENGFTAINCPTMETVPLENLSEFEAKLDVLKNYDGVFLTSGRAADIFRRKMREKKLNFQGKIYLHGKRSFDLLKGENLNLVFFEEANTAWEMLEQIALEDLKNKRFLFVRGEKSLRVVPEFLQEFATVDEAVVYRTKKVTVEIDKIKSIREKIENSEIVCACFFSPTGAEYFLEQFESEILNQTKIAAIGKTTADFLQKQNLKVDFIARKATAEDFAVELVEYLRNG